MTNILIVGNDIHAEKYIQSMLFDSNIKLYITIFDEQEETKTREKALEYHCEFIKNSKIQEIIKNIECIIFSIPMTVSASDLKLLNDYGYKKKIIFEKLFSTDKEDLIEKYKTLPNDKLIFHLRNYDDTMIYLEKKNEISWPCLDNGIMSPIYNVMPNVIDLININDSIDDINIISCKDEDDKLIIELESADKKYTINIITTDDTSELVKINGKSIEWPNYYKIINKVVYSFINNQIDLEKNMNYELKVLEILSNIK